MGGWVEPLERARPGHLTALALELLDTRKAATVIPGDICPCVPRTAPFTTAVPA